MFKTVLSTGVRTWMVEYLARSIVEKHIGATRWNSFTKNYKLVSKG